ncbi:MAG: HD domain-containing protein [Verrucomicrobia bacterium]|nr:HD domain-containing protein [Verrucomicrobiota bacterium]
MGLYEKARQFAVEAHGSIGQVRKYTGEPYHVHVLAVAALVATRTTDEVVLAAACLHDVLEDVAPHNAGFSAERIREEFGEEVLGLVVELTDVYTTKNYPDLNRQTRKQREAERLAQISERGKLIKRADLFDNARSIAGSEFAQVWMEEKRRLDEVLGRWE